MPTRHNFRERREARRQEATERQKVRNARSNAEQLALCRKRRGESRREVARLMGY
jgi:hypothetical protein